MVCKLREAREVKGLNQRELSEKAHLAQSVVSDFERGMRKPWLKAAKRLSRVLGVPVEELFPNDFGIKGTLESHHTPI